MIKVFGSEQIQRVMRNSQEIMGPYGLLKTGSKHAPLDGKLERLSNTYVQVTFAGGTNEVLRDMTTMLGLGLMKSR